jgi:hypothetical protein
MTVVVFTRFRLVAGDESALLEMRWASLESCRATHPGLGQVFLVCMDESEWLDVAFWHDGSGGEGATPFPPTDARIDFFDRSVEFLGEDVGALVVEPTRP